MSPRRKNPLVGYQTRLTRPVSDISVPFRYALRGDAQETFTRVYQNVALPIELQVTERKDFVDPKHTEPILTLVLILEQTRGSASKDFVGMSGEPYRLAPMTPFMCLHRLFDSYVLSDNYFYSLFVQLMYTLLQEVGSNANEMIDYALLYGTDTAAGRIGALDVVTQAWADLFAKYLLTRRIAWKAPDGTPEVVARAFRQIFMPRCKEIFDDIITHLKNELPLVVFI